MAKWFVSLLLTQGKGAEEREQALRLIQRNLHPDLLILDQLWIEGVCTDWGVIARSSNISQEERAKKRAKTDTIGIDDIREMQRRLHETPQTGRTCCLIRSLERLHAEAANALLKILEEPPPHVLFCCTCESMSSLPATVVSRMRTIHFSPLSPTELLPLLSHLTEEDRSLLLSIADGAPGTILRCLEDPAILRALRQLHADALRFLGVSSPRERLGQLLLAWEHSEERLFLQHLCLHLRPRLRDPNTERAREAQQGLQSLFSLLHALQGNTHRFLLAADFALCALPSPFPTPPAL